jgi:hypothetical protein
MDDNLDVIRVIEGSRATLKHRIIEVPLRRSKLPDKLVKVMPVFFVASAASLRRKIKLIPPFEFGLRRQRCFVGSRKNLFDLHRTAVVHNLHVLAKIFTHTTEQSATSS